MADQQHGWKKLVLTPCQ